MEKNGLIFSFPYEDINFELGRNQLSKEGDSLINWLVIVWLKSDCHNFETHKHIVWSKLFFILTV